MINYKINLDTKSDRYRICPECKMPFMTKHRGRDFCSIKCNDDYNNKKKKYKSHSQSISANPALVEENIIIPVIYEQAGEIFESNINQLSSSNEENNAIKENNRLILEELLSHKDEIEIPISILFSRRFNFDLFDSREQILNSKIYKVNYGNYATLWTTPNTILITHQKNLLWTLTR